MDTYNSIQEIRKVISSIKSEGKTVAFVPTMGALHEGHLSLMRIAQKEADVVVVSIYVNPEQFGPNEDYDSYPRTLDSDLEKCRKEGVDLVFAPDDKIIYGSGNKYLNIGISELNIHMDGGSRPGFFEGILLVVNKLFNIIKPDVAVFGQKDAQQYRILNQMVDEFNHDVKMVMGPIVRANDGLALSSRNAYLSDEERTIAPGLYRSLQYIIKQIQDGVKEPGLLLKHQISELEAKGFKNDYLNVFVYQTMQPAETLKSGEKYILAGAAYLGKTRLIDNIIFEI
ncbi:pantoate--beta-alanine ligase [Balneola sp. MJW-20]|uniref:pantoate--beta-alanine ligase n=1 Tax=Gracilimonas aurantiaca TaxID=3234185 RepID=UPI003466FA81